MNYEDLSLKMQPKFLKMNQEQTIMVSASEEEALFVNLETKEKFNLDKIYEISDIKEIIYDSDEKAFYIMANRHKFELGIYLLKIYQNNPTHHSEFIIRWNTKMNIGDVNFYIMRDEKKNLKELIVSYLTIYQNSHNVIIMDISDTTNEEKHMIFRHESFHLWEQQITGLLLQDSKDFVCLSQKGI